MDQKLLDYIKQNKKQGFSDDQIRKALLDAGWKQKDIDQGFKTKPKPKWLIPVIVVVGIIVLGLVVWGAYSLLKPVPVPEDQAADWKTYKNEEYGYEIRLPAEWKAYSEYDGSIIADSPINFPDNPLVLTGNPPTDHFQIAIVENITIDNFINSFFANIGERNKFTTDSGLEGIKFIRGNEAGGKDVFFFIQSGKNILKIYYNNGNKSYDKILKSIIIIDQTADWKTYRNEVYGWEVQYPGDYKIITEEKKGVRNFLVIDGPKTCESAIEGYCFDDIVSIDFMPNQGGITTEDWFNEDESFNKIGTKIIGNQEAIVAIPKETEGYGKKYVFSGGDALSNNTYQYIFNILIYSGVENVLSDQILSTFKFLD